MRIEATSKKRNQLQPTHHFENLRATPEKILLSERLCVKLEFHLSQISVSEAFTKKGQHTAQPL